MSDSGATAVHPIPNRGVLPTETKKTSAFNGLFLDYLRGTVDPTTFSTVADEETGEVFTFSEPNQERLSFLFGELTLLDYSSQTGYDQSASLACGGAVHWHRTKPEQRVMLNLGGDALAKLGMSPLVLFAKLAEMNFKCTRMDWAKDDTSGLVEIEVIKDKIISGHVATRFTKWNEIDGGIIGEDISTGRTLYIGNRKSESFIRVYDKAAEQAAHERVQSNPEHHIRVEYEVKKRRAEEFFKEILRTHKAGGDVAKLVLGVIYGLLDFKEPNEVDNNKWRWETCEWWHKFLGLDEKVRITVPKPEMTLKRAEKWADVISPALAVVKEADPGFVDTMFENGRARWKKHHEARLRRFQLEHDLKTKSREKLQAMIDEKRAEK